MYGPEHEHVAVHCSIENITDRDKSHGWQPILGIMTTANNEINTYLLLRTANSVVVHTWKKEKTTLIKTLNFKNPIHQILSKRLSRGFQAFQIQIGPLFWANNVPSWRRPTVCLHLLPIIINTEPINNFCTRYAKWNSAHQWDCSIYRKILHSLNWILRS